MNGSQTECDFCNASPEIDEITDSPSHAETLANLAGQAMGTTTNFLKAKLRQAEEEAWNKQHRRRRRPER